MFSTWRRSLTVAGLVRISQPIVLGILIMSSVCCAQGAEQEGELLPPVEEGEESFASIAPVALVETGETVIAPPAGTDPFYKKYINADGIVIVSSEKVPDAALIAARR